MSETFKILPGEFGVSNGFFYLIGQHLVTVQHIISIDGYIEPKTLHIVEYSINGSAPIKACSSTNEELANRTFETLKDGFEHLASQYLKTPNQEDVPHE